MKVSLIKKIVPILILPMLFFISCEEKKYTQEICEELSMKKFKGFPRDTKEFNDNCKHIKVKYTKSVCQSALESMILGAKKDFLIKKFGADVMGCFSKNDLKKFGN